MQQTPVSNERRHGGPAIPENLKQLMNPEQVRALSQIENFGWSLAFVRCPLFQTPQLIVSSPDHQGYAVIGEDGELEFDSHLQIRH